MQPVKPMPISIPKPEHSMTPRVLIFHAAKDTKNHTLYQQANGFNKLYLDKGLDQSIEVEIRSLSATKKAS